MKTNNKRARVFKLTPEANAAIEEVAVSTTRNLSNSVCYLINLGFQAHQNLEEIKSKPQTLEK